MAGAPMGAALGQIGMLFGRGTVAGLTDAQLLARFLDDRDAPAFEALVARHGPTVLAVCRALLDDPHDAEDAFQATFLVLARKAAAIRGRDALGGWLHRVARRVAIRANADARRRRARERTAVALGDAADPRVDEDNDDRAAVREEVARLPERYRLPVVLCYLEGRTHAEAAAALRRGEATVRRRLAEARRLLRSRLRRRGVAPAVLLRLAPPHGATSGAVPASWTEAAARFADGTAPASVAALAAGALGGRIATRLAFVGAAVMAVGAAVALAAGVVPRDDRDDPRPDPTPQVKVEAAAPAPAPRDEPAGEQAVRGRVLGPGGGPVSGAKVSLWTIENGREPDHDPAVLAETGTDGRFAFRARRDALAPGATRSRSAQVVATADGFGTAWAPIRPGRVPEDLTLRLAEDLPIEGRILDLEGRPVVGARVGLLWLAIPKGGVGAFLIAVRNQSELKRGLPGDNPSWFGRLPGQAASVVCDAAGRFRMSGLGRDRIAELVVQGPGIADGSATVVTRPTGPVVGPATRRPQPDPPPPLTVHGAAFDHVAPPSRRIVGVVRDRETGRPLPGVRVISGRTPGKALALDDAPGAVTDASGRYELQGYPKTAWYDVAAVPEPGRPHLVGHARVVDNPGNGPLVADLALARGIPFRIRPVDASTGRPVDAEVSYYPLHPNPHVRDVVGFGAAGEGPLSRAKAGPDGSFSGVALPGPGAICVENHEEKYLPAKTDPREFFEPGRARAGPFDHRYGDQVFLIVEQGEQGTWFFPHEQFQAIALIDPVEGSGPIEGELKLSTAPKVEGTILGPDGSPISGVEVYGADRYWSWIWSPPLPGPTFSVTKINPDRPRKILFRHAGRELAGALIAPTRADERPTVRLRPWATFSGRLVDAEGRPRPGVRMEPLYSPESAADPHDGAIPEWVRTDESGRFRVEGLAPGLRYRLDVMTDGGFSEGSNLFKGLTPEPGESRDLGDVRVESDRPRPTP